MGHSLVRQWETVKHFVRCKGDKLYANCKGYPQDGLSCSTEVERILPKGKSSKDIPPTYQCKAASAARAALRQAMAKR